MAKPVLGILQHIVRHRLGAPSYRSPGRTAAHQPQQRKQTQPRDNTPSKPIPGRQRPAPPPGLPPHLPQPPRGPVAPAPSAVESKGAQTTTERHRPRRLAPLLYPSVVVRLERPAMQIVNLPNTDAMARITWWRERLARDDRHVLPSGAITPWTRHGPDSSLARTHCIRLGDMLCDVSDDAMRSTLYFTQASTGHSHSGEGKEARCCPVGTGYDKEGGPRPMD